ncbi:MAG: hypothetical protein LBR65_05565 [Culturomica sp.]|jgi:hypothetical protein|nr:hypothetical protein [Culturomica sp.]
MTGFIVQYMGREFRIGVPDSNVHLAANLVRNEFIFEGGGILASWQIVREEFEFEVEIAEFDSASEAITAENHEKISLIDPEYAKMIKERSENWELEWKLETFRKLEIILKEEGVI